MTFHVEVEAENWKLFIVKEKIDLVIIMEENRMERVMVKLLI